MSAAFGARETAGAATRGRRPPPYHVVLLDDNDHTYGYVTRMLRKLFGHSAGVALRLAQQLDAEGRAVVLTTSREHAELKQEQILAFGADPALPESAGAMSAILEPASG